MSLPSVGFVIADRSSGTTLTQPVVNPIEKLYSFGIADRRDLMNRRKDNVTNETVAFSAFVIVDVVDGYLN